MSGSGISWAICKSAPCSRQITTPAPHRSVFYRPDALPAAQPTATKHWFLYSWLYIHCCPAWQLVDELYHMSATNKHGLLLLLLLLTAVWRCDGCRAVVCATTWSSCRRTARRARRMQCTVTCWHTATSSVCRTCASAPLLSLTSITLTLLTRVSQIEI